MTNTPKDTPAAKASPAKDARQARLNAALRANLKRRKAADAAPSSGPLEPDDTNVSPDETA